MLAALDGKITAGGRPTLTSVLSVAILHPPSDDLVGDLFDRFAVGVDGQLGHLSIGALASREQLADLVHLPQRGERRSLRRGGCIARDPGGDRFDRGGQQRAASRLADYPPILRGDHRAAAEGDDSRRGFGYLDQPLRFQAAEFALASAGKDISNRSSGGALNFIVEIDRLHPQSLAQNLCNSGLPGAAISRKKEMMTHWMYDSH